MRGANRRTQSGVRVNACLTVPVSNTSNHIDHLLLQRIVHLTLKRHRACEKTRLGVWLASPAHVDVMTCETSQGPSPERQDQDLVYTPLGRVVALSATTANTLAFWLPD